MKDINTKTFITTSAEETKNLAERLAAHLSAGDVIVLSGTLGAGKTQFVQGLARGLGVKEPITSPTFALLMSYQSALKQVGAGALYGNAKTGLDLNHFDLYRLDNKDQLEDIAFYEVLESPMVTCIEWGTKFPEALPRDYLEITLTALEDDKRQIKARLKGSFRKELLDLWTAYSNDKKDQAL
jgi:tRNA threonylcarbamoyladenosine biosynthesis protein TsaE